MRRADRAVGGKVVRGEAAGRDSVERAQPSEQPIGEIATRDRVRAEVGELRLEAPDQIVRALLGDATPANYAEHHPEQLVAVKRLGRAFALEHAQLGRGEPLVGREAPAAAEARAPSPHFARAPARVEDVRVTAAERALHGGECITVAP